MNFIKCYLCGCLAVQERVSRDHTQTIFCTSKVCGRYDISEEAVNSLQAGASIRESIDSVITRVYIANRTDERILISLDDLTACKAEPFPSI